MTWTPYRRSISWFIPVEAALALVKDEPHLAWLRELHQRGTVLASVCTGSLVLAAAGLLVGRPATTHRDYLEKLAKTDGSVAVCEGVRYVDDGDVVTSAGVGRHRHGVAPGRPTRLGRGEEAATRLVSALRGALIG